VRRCFLACSSSSAPDRTVPTEDANGRRHDTTWLALKQKIPVKKAAELNDMSEDSFRRHYSHLIKKVSPRRDAVELGDALAVGESKSDTA
jgi:hypothetical protein